MHHSFPFALRGLATAVAVVAVCACTQEVGRVYDMPVSEVRKTLARIELPPLVFASSEPNFRVEASDPAKIVGVVSRGRNEVLRYILTLSQVTDRSTRVHVEIIAPKTGAFGDVDSRLAKTPALRTLYVIAMEEQVTASLLRRPFDIAKLRPALIAATAVNTGEFMAHAKQTAEAAQKRDRDNVAKAYADEAAGNLPRR
jgi:hypothetical protein